MTPMPTPPITQTVLPSAFKRLAWSNLAAQSAEQIALAAAPIVAVMTLDAGVGGTGLLQTAQTLPFLLLAIPAGTLADRMPRPFLMASAEAVRVASLVCIMVLAALGQLTLPILALLGCLGACGTVVYSVAAPALVPALVPSAALPAANSRIELARTVAFAGGPALAGALVGWTGGPPAFGVAAALSVVAAFLLAGLREPHRAVRPARHPMLDIAEGARFVFRNSLLMPVFATQVIFNIAFFVLQAVYVPYAINNLGLSASGVGATLATYGAGMIMGALMAPRIMSMLPFGLVVAIGPLAGLVASGAMALTIWAPTVYLASAGFFLMGAGPIIWVVSTTTLRQTVTPAHLLGRVSAINIVAYGARPVGAIIGALVGDAYGAETCLLVATFFFFLQASLILASPVLRLITQPTLASSDRETPEGQVVPSGATGE